MDLMQSASPLRRREFFLVVVEVRRENEWGKNDAGLQMEQSMREKMQVASGNRKLPLGATSTDRRPQD